MKLLLDGAYAPLTNAWGFFEQPLGPVIDRLMAWRTKLGMAPRTTVLRASLSDALARFTSRQGGRTELLLSTPSRWTAYFNNIARGGDTFGPVSYLALQLSCRSVAVAAVPNTLSGAYDKRQGAYGAVKFELFAPEKREWLNYERSVVAMNDGGRWIFEAQGAVQPYEETETYSQRRIRDRFTVPMLERYTSALGIELLDRAFYGPDGILIEHSPPT